MPLDEFASNPAYANRPVWREVRLLPLAQRRRPFTRAGSLACFMKPALGPRLELVRVRKADMSYHMSLNDATVNLTLM